MVSVYEQLPDDLNFVMTEQTDEILIFTFESEVDEMWSFVNSKANKQWIWLAIDSQTRQIIAFHVGDRSQESAQKLWQLIPPRYRHKANFYTDDWDAYKGVIPEQQHRVSKDEPYRAFQLHPETESVPLGSESVIVLKEDRKPHRGD